MVWRDWGAHDRKSNVKWMIGGVTMSWVLAKKKMEWKCYWECMDEKLDDNKLWCWWVYKWGKNRVKWLLKDAIVKSKDQVFIFKFARDIKSYSINFYDSLMEVILEGGDVQRILRYAEEIKGANITKLADAIIASKNPKYIYEFAQKVENAPVSKLINALAELN